MAVEPSSVKNRKSKLISLTFLNIYIWSKILFINPTLKHNNLEVQKIYFLEIDSSTWKLFSTKGEGEAGELASRADRTKQARQGT